MVHYVKWSLASLAPPLGLTACAPYGLHNAKPLWNGNSASMVPSPSDEVARGGRKNFSPPNAGGGDRKSGRALIVALELIRVD